MIARWAAALLLLACAVARAQSLHESEIGTKVKGSFALGAKTFYLPEGDWTFVAKREWTSVINKMRVGTPFAEVLLLDTRDGKVERVALAHANLRPTMAKQYVHDPCKDSEKVHYQKQLGDSFRDQFCLKVNAIAHFQNSNSEVRQAAHRWALEQKLSYPSAVIRVYYARVDPKDYDWLALYFSRPATAKAAYVNDLAAWGEANARAVFAGLSGERLEQNALPRPPAPR